MTRETRKEREYTVYLLPKAKKELEKMADIVQKRIYEMITTLKEPYKVPAEKMKNEENTYRMKMSDYRIIYKIYQQEVIVVVVKIGHRKTVYKNIR